MGKSRVLVAVLAGVGVLAFSLAAFSATTGTDAKQAGRTSVSIQEAAQRERIEPETGTRVPGSDTARGFVPGTAALPPVPGSSGLFNGILAGSTTWDAQHDGNCQRMIQAGKGTSTAGKTIVHMSWTVLKVLGPIGDPSRQVNYNCYQWGPTTGFAYDLDPSGGLTLTPFGQRGGYTVLDMNSAGNAAVAWHSEIEDGQHYSVFTRISGAWWWSVFNSILPYTSLGGPNPIWPKVAVSKGAPDVYHVVARDSDPSAGDPAINVYWRYVMPSGPWQGPVVMDSSLLISHQVIAAGDRIVFAFAKPRDYGPNRDQYNNDLVYYESINKGADWIASGGPPVSWENGGGFNVTDYVDTDPHRCFVDITGGFDSEGRLHLVYTNPAYDQAAGTVSLGPCELLHWDEGTPGTNERAVVSGGTPGGFVGGQEQYFHTAASALYECAGSPGVWCRNISRPSLAFGDGRTLCKGQPNLDYVYLVYTLFGSEDSLDRQDVSAAGFQNGNVWVSVSPDRGVTWAPPRCLTTADGQLGHTPTRSPGCDVTAGDSCRSEHWPSVASMVNDTMHVFYLGDLDAGSVVHGEGTWAVDQAMYLPIFGGPDGAVCPKFCDCLVWGDANFDGIVNPLDIVLLTNFVYKMRPWPGPPPSERFCPWDLADVNCSGGPPDPADVVAYVNYVYKSKPWQLLDCQDQDGDPATTNDIGCP